jgi:hypothetical protein
VFKKFYVIFLKKEEREMKSLRKVIVLSMFVWLITGCDNEEPEISNPVSWETDRVSLEAENFFLVAEGDTFYADVSNIGVDSDLGDSEYCSLELTWQENGVEMRLFMYFSADGTDWWSDEMRTYNGEVDGDWIYYYGEFFKSNLGTAFTDNVEFEDDTDTLSGIIHFDGLTLQAFLNN